MKTKRKDTYKNRNKKKLTAPPRIPMQTDTPMYYKTARKNWAKRDILMMIKQSIVNRLESRLLELDTKRNRSVMQDLLNQHEQLTAQIKR